MEKLLLTAIVLTFTYTSVGSNRIAWVGNPIKASASGVDVAGVTFLLNDIVLYEGVLFAYSAFFRSDKPVTFQIWRPVVKSSDRAVKTFTLIHETPVIPSVVRGREDIYIESKMFHIQNCLRVNKGDRLGVFMKESPGAISYTFDDKNPTALGHILSNFSDPTTISETVKFDALRFPYDFSVAAYIDTDLSLYNDTEDADFPPCPRDLLVPKYGPVTLPPTPGPTGVPGVMGPPGPRGMRGMVGAEGAAGPQGPKGDQGAKGENGLAGAVGATGTQGEKGEPGKGGAAGAAGPEGPRGDQGEMGPRGFPGVVVNGSYTREIRENNVFTSTPMMYGLLVWLIIVTIIAILAIVIAITCHRRRRRQNNANQFHHGSFDTSSHASQKPMANHPMWVEANKDVTIMEYGTDTITRNHDNNRESHFSSAQEPDPSWMDTLKEDTVADYSVDTINTRNEKNRKSKLEFNFENETHNNIA